MNFMQAQHPIHSEHVPHVPVGQNIQPPIPTQVNIFSGQPGQIHPPSQNIVKEGQPHRPLPAAPIIASEHLDTTPSTSFGGHSMVSQPKQDTTLSGPMDGRVDTVRADENASDSLLRSSSSEVLKTGEVSPGVLQQEPREMQASSPSLSDSSRNVGYDAVSDDEDSDDELRKLDEDFQKNLQRARKVYDSRMDSLQRCKVEREEQHLKTLEKHEKERAEFEKRLAQEAEQQRKRIQQLQLEWDRQRELARTKKKHERSNSDNSHPGHTLSRSVSNASSTKSMEAANQAETTNGGTSDIGT